MKKLVQVEIWRIFKIRKHNSSRAPQSLKRIERSRALASFRNLLNERSFTGIVDVLMCWCVYVFDVLMCWCVDVLMCWCVGMLMCLMCSVDVLIQCVDVLMCWCVWCVDVFDVFDVDVLMCWCAWCVWCVDVLMCSESESEFLVY